MEAGSAEHAPKFDFPDFHLQDEDSAEESDPGSLVDHFREHAKNESSYSRKTAVKCYPEVLYSADNGDLDELLSYVSVFSKDFEVSIKIELYEKLSMIMDAIIHRYGQTESIVESMILPSIINNLTDANSQVRRTSQETMLSFIERNLITKTHVENILWHIIYEMSDSAMHDEFRCDSVHILVKFAQVLGPDYTETNILPRYFDLCSDPFFNVRKICATSFGEISSVLNRVDEVMFEKFFALCEDVVWGVRKACVETIPQISKYCSNEDRSNGLTTVYCDLLEDPSRWVRIAAYQQLGYLIATFPTFDNISKVSTSEFSKENALHSNQSSYQEPKITGLSTPTSEKEENDLLNDMSGKRSRTVSNSYDVSSEDRWTIKIDNSSDFSAINFWRVPLPELDLELEMEEGRPKSISITSRVVDSKTNKVYKSAINVDLENEGSKVVATQSRSSEILNFLDTVPKKSLPPESHVHETSKSTEYSHSSKQDVLPAKLLNNYLKMIEPEVMTLDVDMPRHCAFCFPAVLYTLGVQSWPSLKCLYECLSRDLQWKVRRTLAFSFHEVAGILGPTIIASDLLIFFNEFVHDVDEVKTGIVANLAKLWRAMHPELSVLVLEQLSELSQVENDRNWRYRLQLTEQLNELTAIIAANQIKTFLCPIAWSLLDDKVSDVRKEAFSLMANILKRYSDANFSDLDNFLHVLMKEYGESSAWYKRQIFLNICVTIVDTQALNLESFSKHLLPQFLKIASDDPVANVRLVAARGLSQVFTVKEYFVINTYVLNSLETLREKLKCDHDRDVRESANTVEELIAEESLEREICLDFETHQK